MDSSYTTPTTLRKFDLSLPSTGTDPAGWRRYWAIEARRCGSDWISIAQTVSGIMYTLVGSSSWVRAMTACPTCGADPCVNPDFCRACRDADRRKTRNKLNRLVWNPQPETETKPEKPVKEPLVGEWAADAWNSPTWRQAAADYHRARAGHILIAEIPPEDLARLRRLMNDDVSLERAWAEINHAARERYNEAPEATYNAVVYELRTHGLPQLKNQNCQRRLSHLSTAQLKNLIASLQQWRSQYPKVTDELLTALGAICDGRMMANG
jgi:hypothetical protein